mmetsp:Transcript_5082/g.7749  ORF Transcript_5082/g.7749 Transcript_5082/m.7749 type:complete len:126 (+) Transcript_5082:44-421(+)
MLTASPPSIYSDLLCSFISPPPKFTVSRMLAPFLLHLSTLHTPHPKLSPSRLLFSLSLPIISSTIHDKSNTTKDYTTTAHDNDPSDHPTQNPTVPHPKMAYRRSDWRNIVQSNHLHKISIGIVLP